MSQASGRAPEPLGPIFTIGHSTHPIGKLLELLASHQIAVLADVRSFPSSRRWPQFNQGSLEASLAAAGIEYRWFKDLGGRRHGVRPDSPHSAWQLPAFHSYADYADTEQFAQGLHELIQWAGAVRCAYMCSEGLWWRCHRRLISDHLLLMGWQVMHILPNGRLSAHALPAFAQVCDGRLIYAGPAPSAAGT